MRVSISPLNPFRGHRRQVLYASLLLIAGAKKPIVTITACSSSSGGGGGNNPGAFTTIKERVTFEREIKKSKFITVAGPISDEGSAHYFLSEHITNAGKSRCKTFRGKKIEMLDELAIACCIDQATGISDDEYSDISRGGGNGFATQKGNISSQKPTLRKRSIFKASDLSLKRNQKIKIWEDRKQQAPVVLRPHYSQPVYSVTFLTAPHPRSHSSHIRVYNCESAFLIWMGRIVTVLQTLDLENSFESQIEESFLNQVVTLSQAGLLLIANAKKDAVCYTVRVWSQFGLQPE
ncbi:hypothetical protein RHMOL_Rhmol09G0259400 [Rhododendron molle]|uniref:Uncharacterized protein n=1 Tax=Rhododendron molle TaxID=49168 RepID=A0ACC0MII7_RHOML|nr:hypothetical protein RHMOL_Rhmol09G0259400 [Rhododendron molle]